MCRVRATDFKYTYSLVEYFNYTNNLEVQNLNECIYENHVLIRQY